MWPDIVRPQSINNMVGFMKTFTVKIWAYDHYAKFNVLAEDNAISLEQSILDKLGEKSINWETLEYLMITR